MHKLDGRDPDDDNDWIDVAQQFHVRADTIYLNHGSFGLPPKSVQQSRQAYIDCLNENPMDFYLRQMECLLATARQRLAEFVGALPTDLTFVENATYAMNIVAASFPLAAEDEVLLSDHEYGAVFRIWQRQCERVGAKLVTASLPERIDSHEHVVAALTSSITDKTKLLVCSHITSATALIMPVKEIGTQFAQRGVAVCIDGPHAPAQIDMQIDKLGCDFYAASCHKWLCGTLGSGFLYVAPRWQASVEPLVKSWGRLLPAMPRTWDEEFLWAGSRDPSPYLSVPVAIEFLESVGLEAFRSRSYRLAQYAENALVDLFKTTPIGNRELGWYGSMSHVPLPPGDWSDLQQRLWVESGIEVMVNRFADRWFVRVSTHLYNNKLQIDTLIKELHRIGATGD